jgi:serine/threonine-protein kinase
MSRFQIIRKLGEGGMATVHLASTLDDGVTRLVALKKVKRAAMMDPQQLELFVRELRVASQLNHPGVVQVYDAGIEDDRPYLSMEYVDGPDLDTVINALYAARQRLSPVLVAHIGIKVCEALAYVFTLRDPSGLPLVTAHRDISPSNVLLSARGHVKLADFGVVRMSNSATAVGIVKGKWEYFPPEIITGKPQDARGDVFALGITLYKLYALAHPFVAPTPQEHFNRARTEDPARPGQLPEALWQVLRGALQRDPALRHGSPEAFGAALQGFIDRSGEKPSPRALAAVLRALPLPHPLPPESESHEEDDAIEADDPDDAPTLTEPNRHLIKRVAAGADEDEETEHGLPAFALGARSLSRVSAGVLTAAPPAPPDGSAALYEELRSARAQAGLAVDMTLTEFQHLLLSREQEILRARPGARVRFEIGVRQGKPVVIPKVGRRP